MIGLTEVTVRDLIDDLWRSDEQTGGHPVLSPDRFGLARVYLEQLLLDSDDRFQQHIATLEKLYQANFATPLPRSWHPGVNVPPPQPATAFRHSNVLPEPLALEVTEGGVDRLPVGELARLLLNPYALWDLTDLINTLLPDYWLDRMQEVGVQLARESGIDLYEDFETVVGTKERTEERSQAASPPNLFAFATSELSQDAFICWLASWANPTHRTADPALHNTGKAFLDRLFERGGVTKPAAYQSVQVRPQFHDIDVLVEVNGEFAVIIEDKTDTKDHSNQLPRYVEVVRRELNLPDERIAAIYLKTGDQSNYRTVEQADYGRFLRRDFLEILDQGELAGVRNAIFADFRRYLRAIDDSVESYNTALLGEWNQDWNRWKGFFIALQERLGEGDWDYVPNRAGGFMGFHWHWRDNKFLQLENDELRFKIMVPDESQQAAKRDEWRAALMATNGASNLQIRPSVRREGRYMTVAVLEGDYRQQNSEGRFDLDRTVDVLKRAACFMDEAATGK